MSASVSASVSVCAFPCVYVHALGLRACLHVHAYSRTLTGTSWRSRVLLSVATDGYRRQVYDAVDARDSTAAAQFSVDDCRGRRYRTLVRVRCAHTPTRTRAHACTHPCTHTHRTHTHTHTDSLTHSLTHSLTQNAHARKQRPRRPFWWQLLRLCRRQPCDAELSKRARTGTARWRRPGLAHIRAATCASVGPRRGCRQPR